MKRKNITNIYEVAYFDTNNNFETVICDSFKIAVTIAKAMVKANNGYKALVEVRTTNRTTKHTVFTDKTYAFGYSKLSIVSTTCYRMSAKGSVVINNYHK